MLLHRLFSADPRPPFSCIKEQEECDSRIAIEVR